MKRLLGIILIIFPFLLTAQQIAFEKGEVLIQLKINNSRVFENESKTEFFRSIDFNKSHRVSKNLNVWLYKFSPTANHSLVIDKIKNLPSVTIAQLNHKVSDRSTIPDDTNFGNQWHHNNTGQSGGTADADIDSDEAWDITTGGVSAFGDTIVACILENQGGDLTHPDLIENAWHNYGEIPNNGIDDDNNGYIDDFNGWNINSENDDIGNGNHGTQVSSMVGATGNNSLGISGVNHRVKIMMIRGQSSGNEASVLEAYDYPLTMRKLYNQSNGSQGAFVVVTNASWGVDGGDPASFPLWCNMYDSLGKYGILNIGATTNDNDDVEIVGDMPTQCTSDYMIGVTSTDHEDIRVSAGYGTISIDLAAPGRNVYLANNSGSYASANGTSFASPCVAGAVALLYAAPCQSFMSLVRENPQAAADSVRKYILENVDLIPNLATETVTGGRLNVFNSLNALMNNCDNLKCITPYDVGISNLLDTSVTLNWEGFATDYLLDFRESGDVSWTRFNVDTNFYEISNLEACTSYEFQVYADCGTDTSNVSQTFYFDSDGCCVNPLLSTISADNESINIDWTYVLAADSVDIRYTESGTTDWQTISTASAPLIISDLDTCQTYDIEIFTYCASEQTTYGNTISPSTTGCGSCIDSTYCTAAGSTTFEYIDSVSIGAITNGSGENNGYINFEDNQTTFGPGSQSITIVPGYTGFNYTERFLVYIDINQDGLFNESTELFLSQTSNATINETIVIPDDMVEGLTKMRIVMIGGSTIASSCPSSSFYGEIEDYCVILDKSANISENSLIDFNIYPNPAKDLVKIRTGSNNNKLVIYNAHGQEVLNQNFNQSIDVPTTGLESGFYFVQIKSNDFTSEVKQLIITK